MVATFFLALSLSAPAHAAASFSGRWDTTFGTMTLRQEGVRVGGSYVMGGASCGIEGKVDGSKLSFIYEEPAARGSGWFELAPDGEAFVGKWRQDRGDSWHPWEGRRTAETPDGPPTFSGLWETSYGRMRLFHEGQDVRGSYSYSSSSTLSGWVEDRKLTFRYQEPSARGTGWFELSPDGESFRGKWRADGKAEWSSWTGNRIRPVPGRIWLVVIEARWERSLSEPEYSFGEMLKAFFARSPHVQVRHRFFTDAASLRKWIREASFLAEPVVFSISTHGEPDGIPSDGGKIGAEAIAGSLREVRGLKLLHFSSCLMLKDDLASRIVRTLGKDARFAVSGYTRSIDWGASAVSEFLYFDMILSQGLEPEEAARKLLKLVPFAGDKKIPEAGFEPLGFRFIPPGGR